MTVFEEGQKVSVSEPYGSGSDWVLPGEELYVVMSRGGYVGHNDHRARVRCPSSGVDLWIDSDLLSPEKTTEEKLADLEQQVEYLVERVTNLEERVFYA